MTPTDIDARIEEWEKGCDRLAYKPLSYCPPGFYIARVKVLCAALKVAIQDLSSIRNIDQGKMKNLAQACLDDIESKFEVRKKRI